MRLFLIAITFSYLLAPALSSAQELHQDYQGTWRGEVVEVVDKTTEIVPGTETPQTFQTIRALPLDGPKQGEIITIENDYLGLNSGDRFYFNYNIYIDGSEAYGIINRDRTRPLMLLALVFAAVVIGFGGWQGVRSLAALAGSFAAIAYILLPGILGGYNPLYASIVVAAVVLFGAIYFTHGLNRESTVAYVGTMIAVGLTGVFAAMAVKLTGLTGVTNEAATYLNFNTNGTLDFTALLLGAIIIGVLGVLDDIAVTQAAIVTELFQTDKTQSRRTVYQKAIRIGREHVGALVNTLVLAYTGAALPLLLHFYLSASSISMALSSELFATEIVRTIAGSIGLVLAVPIVTLIAVFYLKDYTPKHVRTHSHHGHSH